METPTPVRVATANRSRGYLIATYDGPEITGGTFAFQVDAQSFAMRVIAHSTMPPNTLRLEPLDDAAADVLETLAELLGSNPKPAMSLAPIAKLAPLFECPVCEYPGLRSKPYETWPPPEGMDLVPPYANQLGRASYDVCPQCGYEFGNDDDPGTAAPTSFEEYRREWESAGRPWFSSREPRPAWLTANSQSNEPDSKTN